MDAKQCIRIDELVYFRMMFILVFILRTLSISKILQNTRIKLKNTKDKAETTKRSKPVYQNHNDLQ